MHITTIREVSEGCFKITCSNGTSFFIRSEYLQHILLENLCCDIVLTDLDIHDLERATFIVAAERKAVDYLYRSEHSRFMIACKLLKKGYKKEFFNDALDFLNAKGLLNDYRFACSWLQNRSITKSEGPTKLFAELLKRGVERSVAITAIDEFFSEMPIDTLFNRAVQKCLRKGKKGLSLKNALIRRGFSLKLINKLQDI